MPLFVQLVRITNSHDHLQRCRIFLPFTYCVLRRIMPADQVHLAHGQDVMTAAAIFCRKRAASGLLREFRSQGRNLADCLEGPRRQIGPANDAVRKYIDHLHNDHGRWLLRNGEGVRSRIHSTQRVKRQLGRSSNTWAKSHHHRG